MKTYLGKVKAGAAAASVLGLLALTACSSGSADAGASGDTSGGASGGKTEVTFAYLGDVGTEAAWDALFSEFAKMDTGITLKAIPIPTSNWAEFSNIVAQRLAGGDDIDIVQVATEGQRMFASKDVLEPLQPYFDRDAELVEDYFSDINPKLKEFNETYASNPNGEVVFVPGGFNTVGMYLNKNVFANAGVDIPEDGQWTWDEFLDAGRKVRDSGADFIRLQSAYFTTIMPFLTTNGASTFDETWTTPQVNSPEAIEAATFMRTIIEEGLSAEPGGEYDEYSLYAQDKLAIVPGGRWPVLSLREVEAVDKTVMVHWPTNTKNGSPIGWDAWNITKASDSKDAAWEFIKFLMSKEAGEYFASVGGTIVPARDSVANSNFFTDNAPEGVTRLSDAVGYATPIPSPDRGAEAQLAIEEYFHLILTGNRSPQDALNALQKELEDLAG